MGHPTALSLFLPSSHWDDCARPPCRSSHRFDVHPFRGGAGVREAALGGDGAGRVERFEAALGSRGRITTPVGFDVFSLAVWILV